MNPRPVVIVFDVNETLSDMSPMAARFTDIGVPAHLAKVWFASLLRDGFALTAAGSSGRFSDLGREGLRVLLAGERLNRDQETAIAHVMDGFSALALHPDVPTGVQALKEAGLRLVTLSNGSAQVAERLLSAGGIRDAFEALLSVEDVGAWKPARAAYEHAARACGVNLGELLLVAFHPWDIDGANRAGLSTAWINRAGGPYPAYFAPPAYTVATLGDLASQLAG
jgi:2-haloacid dehalogenase